MNRYLLTAALGLGLAGAAGAQNVAQVDQTGYNSDAFVTQGGSDNEARTFQVNTSLASTDRNSATITQSGSDQNAAGSEIFDIPGVSAFAAGFGITGDQAPGIVQFGSGNVDEVDQSGTHNSGIIVSLGDKNKTTITQSNANNVAGSLVDGDENDVTIDQSGSTAFLFGFSNAAGVAAIGSGNDVTVSQMSGAETNVALVGVGLFGASANNDATVTQDGGTRNLALVGVQGGGNLVGVTQSGTANDAFVTIDSGDLAFQNNSTTVFQNGLGDIATVNVTGNGNTSITTQN